MGARAMPADSWKRGKVGGKSAPDALEKREWRGTLCEKKEKPFGSLENNVTYPTIAG